MMADISLWSHIAEVGYQKSTPAPDGAPEGWTSPEANDWARETMAAVRRWYDDAEWIDDGVTKTVISGTQFNMSTENAPNGTPFVSIYTTGRRVRAAGALTSIIYGTITSSTWTGSNVEVTVAWDSGALVIETITVAYGIVSPRNQGGLPSGTQQLFKDVPVGWQAVAGAEDEMLRIASDGADNAAGNPFTGIFTDPYVTKDHTLTLAQIPIHGHNVSAVSLGAGSHTHTLTGTVDPVGNHTHGGFTGSESAHTHGVGTLATSSEGAHTHSYQNMEGGTNGGQIGSGDLTNLVQNKTTGSNGAHTHTLTGATAAGSSHTHSIPAGGNHSHGVSSLGTSDPGDHTHTINVSQSNAGSGQAHSHDINLNVNYRTMALCIKQ